MANRRACTSSPPLGHPADHESPTCCQLLLEIGDPNHVTLERQRTQKDYPPPVSSTPTGVNLVFHVIPRRLYPHP
jgi:hypothetical protein